MYDTNPSSSPQLSSISTRAKVRSSDPIIAGFIINGSASKKVLIRAVGPTMSSFGINGVLANPTITLYNVSGWPITTNDDWGQAWNASEIPGVSAQVYAFPLPQGSADSVLLMNVMPGTYTAIVSGVAGGEGVALVEVYVVN